MEFEILRQKKHYVSHHLYESTTIAIYTERVEKNISVSDCIVQECTLTW